VKDTEREQEEERSGGHRGEEEEKIVWLWVKLPNYPYHVKLPNYLYHISSGTKCVHKEWSMYLFP